MFKTGLKNIRPIMTRTHRILATTLLTLSLAAIGTTAHAQRIGLKTNVLYWATATPNFGLEFRLNRHITLNLDAAYNRLKVSDLNSRGEMGNIEMRYWFSARPQAGHFMGIIGTAANYNILLNDTRHTGDAFGGGLTYGYSFVLGKRWSLETSIGAGALHLREKRYDETKETAPETPNRHQWVFAPLKAGVTLVYIIK